MTGLVSQTPGAVLTATLPVTVSLTPTAAGTMTGTVVPALTGTPPTPTEIIPLPRSDPPALPAAAISIWHSWSGNEAQVLETVIQTFQNIYPNVRFDVLYLPAEQLRGRYATDVYRGNGPSLLFGPAEWGPVLFDQGLVADLTDFLALTPDFVSAINPAAQETARYTDRWISLPYALSGVLLYRNTALIASPPPSFEALLTLSQAATGAGVVGADLERGFFYSGAHLSALGGQWMDALGNPVFNADQYKLALAWLDLLAKYDQAGPTELNSNRDVELFASGKAGIIIDGSWNRQNLAQAIGVEQLAIDPWPVGLSGFIQAESVYVNPNLTAEAQYAALQFVGFMLAPEVQTLLAEGGFIPSVVDALPRDPLILQAMYAFKGATAYPTRPEAFVYREALEAALYAVFNDEMDGETALQQAYEWIAARLVELRQP